MNPPNRPMNPPNSEPSARPTPLSNVIDQIESVCTFDHKLPVDAGASTIWMTHLQFEDDRLFDEFLFYLLSELQAYEAHVIQLYSPSGSNPRLSGRISSVAKIRKGILSAKACSWTAFNYIFDDSFRETLSFLKELALHEFTEVDLPDDQLDPIRIRVQDLFTEVKDSSLDPKLKELILQNLRRILSSIRTFKFGSTRNLRQTLDAVLAAFFRSHNLFGSITDPEAQTLINHVVKVIFDLDTLVGHALKLPALASQTVQQFPLLPPGT